MFQNTSYNHESSSASLLTSFLEQQNESKQLECLCVIIQSTEFCNTSGYDTLVKRLKDGKRMCQDFEEYLEKR